MPVTLERVSSGHGLLEGPVWHPRLGTLVADVQNGGVNAYNVGKPPQLVVPHRKGIGGMALHADGGLIVGGRNIAHKRLDDAQAPTAVLLDANPGGGWIGFNDLTTDAAGRIYAGSLAVVALERQPGETRTGFLHLIDLDGSARIVAKDVMLTNGLGFSPDGKRLYHSDSGRHHIRVYEVAKDGSLSPPQEFARVTTGIPDGLAVDAAGVVWVALARGGAAVVGFAPDGREFGRIPVPVPMVTSVAFGGEDGRDLWVVTGPQGAEELGGCVFHGRVDVPGLARPFARVAVKR